MSRPWILLPAHNRRALTLDCLRHLSGLGADRRFEIAVIDDGSTDGTGAAVQATFPAVRVIPGDGQLWWTGAIARGMQAAAAAEAPCVLWLNDDCWPEPGALEFLVARATQEPPAIAGAVCRAENTGGPVPTGFIGRQPLAAPSGRAAETSVDGLSGFCVAVPRAAWIAAGLPDAVRFPHYRGDGAYTWRLHRLGMAVVLCGSARARLVHYQARAATVRDQVARLSGTDGRWRAVFLSPKSPFRAATEWHYLRLRYGPFAGSLLALLRLAGWQIDFIRAAMAGARGSAAAR